MYTQINKIFLHCKNMPFVSEAQRRKCYVLQRQMNEKGLVSNWDCKKFGEESRRSGTRSAARRKSSKKALSPKKQRNLNGEQTFQGPRGGKYVLRKNKKVYL
jgi:hypothetical protein